MRTFLLGTICIAGILSGCTQLNTDQSKEINDLKKQMEQISLENEALIKQANSDYSTISAINIEKYPQTLYKKKA